MKSLMENSERLSDMLDAHENRPRTRRTAEEGDENKDEESWYLVMMETQGHESVALLD